VHSFLNPHSAQTNVRTINTSELMALTAPLMAPGAIGAESALVAMSNPLMITAFGKRKRVQDVDPPLFFESCKKVAASQF
jgi:hypothetical protein